MSHHVAEDEAQERFQKAPLALLQLLLRQRESVKRDRSSGDQLAGMCKETLGHSQGRESTSWSTELVVRRP